MAAATGAVLRYSVDAAVIDRTEGLFPRGTLVINVTGAFALGAVLFDRLRDTLAEEV